MVNHNQTRFESGDQPEVQVLLDFEIHDSKQELCFPREGDGFARNNLMLSRQGHLKLRARDTLAKVAAMQLRPNP